MALKIGSGFAKLFGLGKATDDIAAETASKVNKIDPGTPSIASPIKQVDEISEAGSKVYSQSPAVLPKSTTFSKAAKVGLFAGGGILGGGIATAVFGSGEVITPDPVVDDISEAGGNTYIYNTGSEAVDEGLNWLQTQIDEIVDFLGGIFGGGAVERIGGEFGDIGEIAESKTPASIAKVGLVALAIIAAIVVFVKMRGKKGRSKK